MQHEEPSSEAHAARCISRIDDYVYVAGHLAAADPDVLAANRITHVLCLGVAHPRHPGVEYMQLRIMCGDEPGVDLAAAAPLALAFILRAAARRGRVLIHCRLGVSRSPAVAAVYLMTVYMMSLGDALAGLRAARPFISINRGLMSYIHQLEAARLLVDLAPAIKN